MNPEAIMYLIPLGGMAVGALVLTGVYKLIARWMDVRQGRAALPHGELAELKAELAAVHDLRDRVMELEERVDFAERLLARPGKD